MHFVILQLQRPPNLYLLHHVPARHCHIILCNNNNTSNRSHFKDMPHKRPPVSWIVFDIWFDNIKWFDNLQPLTPAFWIKEPNFSPCSKHVHYSVFSCSFDVCARFGFVLNRRGGMIWCMGMVTGEFNCLALQLWLWEVDIMRVD